VLSGLSSLYEGFDSKKICEIEARGSWSVGEHKGVLYTKWERKSQSVDSLKGYSEGVCLCFGCNDLSSHGVSAGDDFWDVAVSYGLTDVSEALTASIIRTTSHYESLFRNSMQSCGYPYWVETNIEYCSLIG
jgi:hypothetical protein